MWIQPEQNGKRVPPVLDSIAIYSLLGLLLIMSTAKVLLRAGR
jgi:hypothetical protein